MIILSIYLFIIFINYLFKKNRYPPNTYSVKALNSVINGCDAYREFFVHLKTQLINLTLNPDMYNNIVKRRVFYYEHGTNSIPPPEPCFSKFIRSLFSKSPSPYHFDYSLSNPTQNAMEEALFTVRQKFGYSSRRSSYMVNSIPITRSSKSLKSPEATPFVNNNSNTNTNHCNHEVKHRTTFSSKVLSNNTSSRYKSCPDMKQPILIDVTSPKEEDEDNS